MDRRARFVWWRRVWSLNASKVASFGLLCATVVCCRNPHAPPGASVETAVTSLPRLSQAPGDAERREPSSPRDMGAKTHAEEPKDVGLEFPSDLTLHTPLDVPLAGDRPLRVAHAPGAVQRAAIYLHGMCGDPEGADPWIDIATKYATVITVRANVKCPDRPGYKWPQDPAEIQPRIDAALEAVKSLRNGHLSTDQVALIGYSQGSHRGEKLAAAYPDRYRELILGGPPTAADPSLLTSASAVAVLGGELEDSTHMQEGQWALEQAGIRSKFFLLPHAHHGTYGPEGRRVMTDVLKWLWPNAK